MKFQLEADKFAAIAGVANLASTDSGRPLLTGVLIEVKGSEVTATATDSYILGRVTVEAEIEAEAEIITLVNAKQLLAAAKSAKRGLVAINIPGAGSELVTVEVGGDTLGLTVVESASHYPKVHGVIPAESAYSGSTGVPAVGINANYLAKFAKLPAVKAGGGVMRLEFVDQSRPIRIMPLNGGTWSPLVRHDFLIMPVRTSN